VFLYAFDLLELDGDDLRQQPLEARKGRLGRVLARASAGIQFNEHVELHGATVFDAACKMGLERIVSKRRDFPYRSGPSKGWIKVKNPASPQCYGSAGRGDIPGGGPQWSGWTADSRLRQEAKMSQSALAKMLGLTVDQVQKCERGLECS
jgi:hypothetical protein